MSKLKSSPTGGGKRLRNGNNPLDESALFHYVAPMSKPVPASQSEGQSDQDLPFEEALTRLESIVESMEADDLPLERLLASFEDGMKLVQICQKKLGEAELKVQQLEKTAAGATILKPASISAETSED